jgi:predicted ABC-type exoprotein transport system permease subunit
MNSRAYLVLILVLSALVCGYDVFAAVRSGGHNIVAWLLAVLMALIAASALRKLIRQDYSNSWW